MNHNYYRFHYLSINNIIIDIYEWIKERYLQNA